MRQEVKSVIMRLMKLESRIKEQMLRYVAVDYTKGAKTLQKELEATQACIKILKVL